MCSYKDTLTCAEKIQAVHKHVSLKLCFLKTVQGSTMLFSGKLQHFNYHYYSGVQLHFLYRSFFRNIFNCKHFAWVLVIITMTILSFDHDSLITTCIQ